MVSNPRISLGPAGSLINRDYARRGWAAETGHPNWKPPLEQSSLAGQSRWNLQQERERIDRELAKVVAEIEQVKAGKQRYKVRFSNN